MGGRYYRSEFVQSGFQEGDLPIFGKIVDIIIIAGSISVVQIHLSAFQVSHTSLNSHFAFTVTQYGSVLSPGDSSTYITMR
jgi:hypothetical protein